MTRSRARAAVFLITVALGCAITTAPALASSQNAPTAGQAASGWLARQMTHGSHFVTVYSGVSYPNQGETIDAIFAFAATKTANSYGARATAWLEQPSVLANYISYEGVYYAGSIAKVALAAEVRGVNPARFGQANLIKRLAKMLTKSGVYGPAVDSDAFDQSLAIIALSRHGGAPAKAASFLISGECKNGGFPLYFDSAPCASDVDATAIDVQALLATGHRAAAVRGLTWLAGVQHRDGGFEEIPGTAPVNANTTGLAGEAFAAAKWYHRAARARNFLLSLQLGCSAKASERGAIAYDTTGFVKSTAIDATAQGILGLADVSLASLSARGSASGDPRLECAG